MPGLTYPFVFECDNCGTETTVTREDARDSGLHPDMNQAVDVVLEMRGWVDGPKGYLVFCPDCTDAAADAEPGPRLRSD
ncbi:hypothetical protein [Salinibacter ruber]|uniref:hypothetical protein n=1 Tax=Salinibacter ruber TaxID=146919 RepID=UPI0020733C91|nr:hypothetical protein [Salinibacter ruber]